MDIFLVLLLIYTFCLGLILLYFYSFLFFFYLINIIFLLAFQLFTDRIVKKITPFLRSIRSLNNWPIKGLFQWKFFISIIFIFFWWILLMLWFFLYFLKIFRFLFWQLIWISMITILLEIAILLILILVLLLLSYYYWIYGALCFSNLCIWWLLL